VPASQEGNDSPSNVRLEVKNETAEELKGDIVKSSWNDIEDDDILKELEEQTEEASRPT